MGDSGFKGTSIDQDRRFADKESKLLRNTKFPESYSAKVDLRKVNLAVMRPWMVKEVTRLLGFEDEVVVEYAMGLLEDSEKVSPDPRKIQIALTGFLESKTQEFTTALWDLLVSAQTSLGGIPSAFIEEKKAEMRAKEEKEKAAVSGRWRQPGPGVTSGAAGGYGSSNAPPPQSRPGFDSGRAGGGRQGYTGGGRENFAPQARDQGYGARANRPSRFDQPAQSSGFTTTTNTNANTTSRQRSRSRSPPPYHTSSSDRRNRSPEPSSRYADSRRRPRSRSPPGPPTRTQDRYSRPDSRSPPPARRRRRSFSPTQSRSSPPGDRRRRPTASGMMRQDDESRRREDGYDGRRRRSSRTPERRRRDDTPEMRRRDDDTPERRRRDETPPESRKMRGRSSSPVRARDVSRSRSLSRSRSRSRSESSVSIYRSPSP
ncbi:Splicing coactivator SRm160/300, subunit SRm160 (contains PWI domain) [Phaffia rhodozyma]|uniref:Splicing coactivator SRm160/300, subunit SRm160 (Contains PWI domain) n=1 Tax=Phaffia rhodozyma TaxID=264483 RepID=A0A0F7SV96_PHARH|nr:Splicing coactivator SRm160/300, subunit SRm160 (contains PWI domain) [Phaffia rhodozyma]